MPTEKLLLRALSGETLPRPPIWLMRQAGRYLPEYRALRARAGGFLDLCFTPELAVEATLQPLRRFPLDAAILFSDILVVPHGMGQRVGFREGEGPVLEPLRDMSDVDRLEPDAVVERLQPVYAAVRGVAEALPDGAALIGFAGAPWTVASYMVEGGGSRDFARVKTWAIRDPDGFGRLIDILVEATAAHLSAQIAAGAEAVQLFDSWAGALPASMQRRWSLRPMAEIAARLRERHPGIPVIAFPRAVGAAYECFAASGAFAALSLDQAVPLDWAARQLQSRLVVQGSLDPHVLVVGGGPMRAEAGRILDAFSRGPFVFNLGHGIVPQTPPENVAELVELVRDDGAERPA